MKKNETAAKHAAALAANKNLADEKTDLEKRLFSALEDNGSAGEHASGGHVEPVVAPFSPPFNNGAGPFPGKKPGLI